jgi:hypothetical protein
LKFTINIVVKKGAETLATIRGLPKDMSTISMDNFLAAGRLEEELERLTGLRFHITAEQLAQAGEGK